MVTFQLMTVERNHEILVHGTKYQIRSRTVDIPWTEIFFGNLRTHSGSIGFGLFGSQTHSIASFA